MRRVHFIGIGGTAMATLAAILKRQGDEVRGSDGPIYPPMSDFLAAEGIVPFDGFREAQVAADLDFVVVGNAISRGNPELEAVLDRRIRYRSLPEVLRDTCLWDRRAIVVAGTHGKTTTASMTTWLLAHAGRDPGAFIGGIAANLGDGGAGLGGSSYRLGAGAEFVVEGDEYDSAFFDKTPKFLKYVPEIAIVGNVEFDHADIYADLAGVRQAFVRLVQLLPRSGRLVLGAESPDAAALAARAPCRVETFGLQGEADWRAEGLEPDGFGTRFAVRRAGALVGRFALPVPGRHNVRNALAALAVGSALGIDAAVLADGLRGFRGVRRRLELAGRARDVSVFDDFAHHPTAVAETLAALRQTRPAGRLWAVFEPRSASACRRVFQDAFVEAFTAADEVVLAGVFRQTLPEAERLSGEQLVRDLERRGRRARLVPEVDGIVDLLGRECRAGDVVAVMSNGGFGGIHGRLLRRLREEPA